MPIDYDKLMQWRFAPEPRAYAAADAIRVARGFGAGLPGELHSFDAPYVTGRCVLPMMAIALADGEFWQQRPETGIDWRRIVHAEEALTVHGPLPTSGRLELTQRIRDIYDRGEGRGAVMWQQQCLADGSGKSLATIDVTTMLLGDGGFGGKPYPRDTPDRPRIPADRAPDATLTIRTPANDADAMFRLDAGLSVVADLPPGKSMMRGVGCFGLVGRGVLSLVCREDPSRLKSLRVRYRGPMYTAEDMWLELWHTAPGQAVFRMSSRDRCAIVIDGGCVEYTEQATL